jgi:hypothetical protein
MPVPTPAAAAAAISSFHISVHPFTFVNVKLVADSKRVSTNSQTSSKKETSILLNFIESFYVCPCLCTHQCIISLHFARNRPKNRRGLGIFGGKEEKKSFIERYS